MSCAVHVSYHQHRKDEPGPGSFAAATHDKPETNVSHTLCLSLRHKRLINGFGSGRIATATTTRRPPMMSLSVHHVAYLVTSLVYV